MLHLRFFGYYLHGSSTKHKGGTHKHRITDLACYLDAISYAGHSLTFRLRDMKFHKKLLE